METPCPGAYRPALHLPTRASQQPSARHPAVTEGDLGEAPGEEGPLDRVGGELQGAAVGGGRLRGATQTPEQVGPGGVEEVVAVEVAGGGQVVHQVEAGGRALDHGHGDRVVEGDHRGAGHRQELAVEDGDAPPVGGRGGRGDGVQGGDAGLEAVGAGRAAADRLVEQVDALADLGPVPAAAVLLLQQHQLAARADPPLPAGVVEQQQSQ